MVKITIENATPSEPLIQITKESSDIPPVDSLEVEKNHLDQLIEAALSNVHPDNIFLRLGSRHAFKIDELRYVCYNRDDKHHIIEIGFKNPEHSEYGICYPFGFLNKQSN